MFMRVCPIWRLHDKKKALGVPEHSRCVTQKGIQGSRVPWTPRYYPKTQITQGADRVSGPTRRRGHPSTGRAWPRRPRKRREARHGQLANATLVRLVRYGELLSRYGSDAPPTRHGHATGRDLPRPLPWIMTKTILAEAARLRSAVQTKSPLSWDSSEAHGEAGVISYRANIIALPYRAQPLASGNRLIGISKKAPLSAGLE